MIKNSVENMFLINILIFSVILIGSSCGRDIRMPKPPSPPLTRIEQCREGCFQKFVTVSFACRQEPECAMCWEQCAEPSKVNTSIQNTWSLQEVSMIRQGVIVSAFVTWLQIDAPTQCLVTWEVSGGGLMGNLLTDSNTVQLSLWPDTKYRVQVTCKNKKTEVITRSLPLTLDTSRAVDAFVGPLPSFDDVDKLLHPKINLDLLLNNDIHKNQQQDDEQPNDYVQPASPPFYIAHHQTASTPFSQSTQIFLGIFAAVVVFFIVLMWFLICSSRNRTSKDCENLIENEVRNELSQSLQTVHV